MILRSLAFKLSVASVVFWLHIQREIDSFIAAYRVLSNLHPQFVEEDYRIHELQRERLPGRHLGHHSVLGRIDDRRGGSSGVPLGQKVSISRSVMPRAYMSTILSSKPVKRRSRLEDVKPG